MNSLTQLIIDSLIGTVLSIFPFVDAAMFRHRRFWYSLLLLAVVYMFIGYVSPIVIGSFTGIPLLLNLGFYFSWSAIINYFPKRIAAAAFLKYNTGEDFWKCMAMSLLSGLVFSISSMLGSFLMFARIGQYDLGLLSGIPEYHVLVAFEMLVMIAIRVFLSKNSGFTLMNPKMICFLLALMYGDITVTNTVYGMLCNSNPRLTMNYARILIYTILLLVLILFVLFQQFRLSEKTKQAEILETTAAIYRDRIEALFENETDTVKFNHYVRYHLKALQQYMEEGNFESAESYVHGLMANFKDDEVHSFSENIYINTVANYISKREKDIEITVDSMIGNHPGVDPVDLGIIIMNLLEKSILRIREYGLPEKVRLYAVSRENMICLSVQTQETENTISKPTTDNYIEVTIVNHILEKYNGQIIEDKGDCSRIDVLLNRRLPVNQNNDQVNTKC